MERYVKKERVGGGGFAEVYRVVDLHQNQTVAMKELRDLCPDHLRRFKRECDMLRIHHDNPHVVDILGWNLSASPPYLILEFSKLGSLERYVTRRRDWRRIAGWLCDIARGLEIIRQRGHVHRDIKPSNALRFQNETRQELIKLTDFGLGQRKDNPSGVTCSVRGTKGYIDPIAEMTGIYTQQSDIYSLGVTMRELLTGSRTKTMFTRLPGPLEFACLVDSMTDPDVRKRPSPRYIYQTVARLVQAPTQIPAQPTAGTGLFWGFLGLGAAALAIAANANSWDTSVQRYRDSKGRFASGWL